MTETSPDSTFAYWESAFDVRLLIRRIWSGRSTVLIVFALVTVLFAGVAFLMTPIYRAATVLVPADSGRGGIEGLVGSSLSQLGGLASLAGINVGAANSETEEVLAVLRSRNFIERFIVQLELMPKLFPDHWSPTQQAWSSSGKKLPTLGKAYRYFSKQIFTVSVDKKSGLVTVSVYWKDRNEAANWANELVRQINIEMRSRAIEQADTSIKFLQNESNKTSEIATRDAISRLIETQVKRKMLANVTQEYAFRVVDKAIAPDVDDIYRPRRLLLIVVGAILGLFAGVIGALTIRYFRDTSYRVMTADA